MTKLELQKQLEEAERKYFALYHEVEELRNLIIEGNKETNETHIPSKSIELYENYNELLIEKVEELTGTKVNFCYYTFY